MFTIKYPSMPLIPMTVDTYGLKEEKYLEIFKDKSRLMYRTMREMVRMAKEENVDLNNWPHDVIWRMYESISYDANEEARVIQKEKNPLDKAFEYDFTPSRLDLMTELKAIKELVSK
jgi:hypothetical protein